MNPAATNLPAAMLGRDEIARRIPHQGRMCLLERVQEWSAEGIRCEAVSHLAPDNPLRAHGRLGIACGIEYAAQAMAVHGALLAQQAGHAGAVPRGYLAGVRGVRLHAADFNEVQGPITVRAERVMGDSVTIIYDFQVEAGERPLIGGRATVVLDAAAVARPQTQEST